MSNTNHLIGLHVVIESEAKSSLEIDWEEGEILTIVTTERGVAAHVVNRNTGEITPALLLEALKLSPKVLGPHRGVADLLADKK